MYLCKIRKRGNKTKICTHMNFPQSRIPNNEINENVVKVYFASFRGNQLVKWEELVEARVF